MNNTREKLLDAAYDLVRNKGINAVSYNDLSKLIGIRKASVHYYFPKKEDLICALLERGRGEYWRKYEPIVSGQATPREKLVGLAEVYKRSIPKNKLCILGILSAEGSSLEAQTGRELKSVIKSIIDLFEKVFIQAEDEGTLLPGSSTYYNAYCFFNLMIGSQIVGRTCIEPECFDLSVRSFINAVITN